MFSKLPTIVLLLAFSLIAFSSAIPLEPLYELDDNQFLAYDPVSEEQLLVQRVRRSPKTEEEKEKERKQGWEVKPGLGRDDKGNTAGGVELKRVGEKHDFEAGWGKVIRGPARAKPTWHVGGTFRW